MFYDTVKLDMAWMTLWFSRNGAGLCSDIKQNPAGLVIRMVILHRIALHVVLTQSYNSEWFCRSLTMQVGKFNV